MKILLQHMFTSHYYSEGGGWTANPEDAFDFQHSQRAIAFTYLHGLVDIQVAVQFIDSQFNATFPIPALAPQEALS